MIGRKFSIRERTSYISFDSTNSVFFFRNFYFFHSKNSGAAMPMLVSLNLSPLKLLSIICWQCAITNTSLTMSKMRIEKEKINEYRSTETHFAKEKKKSKENFIKNSIEKKNIRRYKWKIGIISRRRKWFHFVPLSRTDSNKFLAYFFPVLLFWVILVLSSNDRKTRVNYAK